MNLCPRAPTSYSNTFHRKHDTKRFFFSSIQCMVWEPPEYTWNTTFFFTFMDYHSFSNLECVGAFFPVNFLEIWYAKQPVENKVTWIHGYVFLCVCVRARAWVGWRYANSCLVLFTFLSLVTFSKIAWMGQWVSRVWPGVLRYRVRLKYTYS